jgi:phosphatidylglycerophosphate synthase
MPIIKEMRQVCQQRRPNAKGKMVWSGHWFNRFFSRYFSIYITWFFLKLGVSANTATFLIIPTALLGVLLCIPHILWINILGCSLVIMAEVLDCVDGELARWTKKSSMKGFYLDLVSHVLCNAPVSMICGLRLYLLFHQIRYMILAFVAYATIEILIGLCDVYRAVICESSSNEGRKVRKNFIFGSNQVNKSNGRWPINFVKRMLHILTDHVVIRLISIICILASHIGIIIPLVFFSWLFPILGIIVVIGDIANKFFFLVPDLEHTKVALH